MFIDRPLGCRSIISVKINTIVRKWINTDGYTAPIWILSIFNQWEKFVNTECTVKHHKRNGANKNRAQEVTSFAKLIQIL